ncbi:MAG: hypothetical protein ACYDAY_09270 [Candidatus Dormibacteria bacterium]
MKTGLEDNFALAVDRIVFGDPVEVPVPKGELAGMVSLASHLSQTLVPVPAPEPFRTRLRAHLLTAPVVRARESSVLDRLAGRVRLPEVPRSRWIALGSAAAAVALVVTVAVTRQRAGIPTEVIDQA